MEKLVYVVAGGAQPPEMERDRLFDQVVPAARAVGAMGMRVLVPDLTEAIRAASPMRVSPSFDAIGAVFEGWLPSLDARGAIEQALAAEGRTLWGYLVTESIVVPCPHVCADGERVPGVTQWGMNDKPATVSDEDFYREWQVVHSEMSFALHPLRESYDRNAVARRLTPETPQQRAIVLERFPSLEVFVDDARYFGEPAVLQEMIDHLPTFYEPSTAVTGGMSEYRFA